MFHIEISQACCANENLEQVRRSPEIVRLKRIQPNRALVIKYISKSKEKVKKNKKKFDLKRK